MTHEELDSILEDLNKEFRLEYVEELSSIASKYNASYICTGLFFQSTTTYETLLDLDDDDLWSIWEENISAQRVWAEGLYEDTLYAQTEGVS